MTSETSTKAPASVVSLLLGVPNVDGKIGLWIRDAAMRLSELAAKEAELSQERAKVTKLRAKLYLLKEEIRRLWLDK